jgi:hypothetical protein
MNSKAKKNIKYQNIDRNVCDGRDLGTDKERSLHRRLNLSNCQQYKV